MAMMSLSAAGGLCISGGLRPRELRWVLSGSAVGAPSMGGSGLERRSQSPGEEESVSSGSPAPRGTPAKKVRWRPAAAPAAPAAAIAEQQRDVRGAELEARAVVEKNKKKKKEKKKEKEKSAELARVNAHLEDEVRHLRQVNASLLAINAQKDKQLQAQQEKLYTQLRAQQEQLRAQQEKLIDHLFAATRNEPVEKSAGPASILRRLLSRKGAK